MSTVSVEALREPIVRILQNSGQRVPGWVGALVATVDGRQIAVHHSETMDAARVSAMIGSVVALGETVCRELKFGRSQSLIVSAAGGHMLALRVPAQRDVLVLGVLAKTDATLGLILHEARACAAGIGTVFDELQRKLTAMN